MTSCEPKSRHHPNSVAENYPFPPTEENEPVDTLELIRTAHLIDQQLEKLAAAVADEALKKCILITQAEWQKICYDTTRLACGIETGSVSGTTRKRTRKRAGAAEEVTDRPDESQVSTEAGE